MRDRFGLLFVKRNEYRFPHFFSWARGPFVLSRSPDVTILGVGRLQAIFKVVPRKVELTVAWWRGR